MQCDPEYREYVVFYTQLVWRREAIVFDPSGRFGPCPYEHLGIKTTATMDEILLAWNKCFKALCPHRTDDISDAESTGETVPKDLTPDQLTGARLLQIARDFTFETAFEVAPERLTAPYVKELERVWQARVAEKDPAGELGVKKCPFEQLGLDRTASFRQLESAWHRLRASMRPVPWANITYENKIIYNLNDDARDFAKSMLDEMERAERTRLMQSTEVLRLKYQGAAIVLHREAQMSTLIHSVEETPPFALRFGEDAVFNGASDAKLRLAQAEARLAELGAPSPQYPPRGPIDPRVAKAWMHLINARFLACYTEYKLPKSESQDTPDIKAQAQYMFDNGLNDSSARLELVGRLIRAAEEGSELANEMAGVTMTTSMDADIASFLQTHIQPSPGSFVPYKAIKAAFENKYKPVQNQRAFATAIKTQLLETFPSCAHAHGALNGYRGIALK